MCQAGEMARRLRALTALPEVLYSTPKNHMVAHNNLMHSVPSSGISKGSYTTLLKIFLNSIVTTLVVQSLFILFLVEFQNLTVGSMI